MTTGAEAAAIANAIKASGAIVRVEPDDFLRIATKVNNPLIVVAEGGWMRKYYQYLTSYKGLIFFAKSPHPISLGLNAEIIRAGTIWVPN
jgi:predicted neuraminidase